MKKILKSMIIGLLSLWTILGFSLTIQNNQDFAHMLSSCDNSSSILLYKRLEEIGANFSGSNIVWLMVFIFVFIMIKKALEIKEKRVIVCALLLATIFSLFQIIGASITYYLSIQVLFSYFLIMMIKMIGLIIGYTSFIILLFTKLAKRKQEEKREISFFTSNPKSIVITTIICLIAWLPYFLKEFPGITNYDSIYQLQQVFGIMPLTSWHPVIHTLLIKICMMIGNGLFHSVNAGVAIYSIFQMSLMATIFSFLLWYMAKKKMSFEIRVGTLLYFAFCPTIPLMNLMMGKDTIFAGLMILLLIVFIELMTNTENLLKSKKRIIASWLIILMTTLFRNNAMHMLILTVPFVVLYKKGYRLKISALFIGSISAVLIIQFVVTNLFHIPQTNEWNMPAGGEKFSVPIQQFIRVILDNEETMTQEEKDEISKFFKTNQFYKRYNEVITDPVRDLFHYDYYLEHKMEFFKLYFHLFCKYPRSYFDAFFCMTSGYFDPEESRNSVVIGNFANDLGIQTGTIWNSYFVNFVEKLMYVPNIPIISMIFNTAIGLWMILLSLTYTIYQKRYEISFVFLPIILYLFTICLGPLNAEYRYIFFEFTVLPILVGFTINQKNQGKEKGEKNG